MLNIANCFVEIKREKIEDERWHTSSAIFSTGFIGSIGYDDDDDDEYGVRYKTVGTNVTDKMSGNAYRFNEGITLIYLYDVRFDWESIEYIKRYGGRLHNASSTDFTVLTYFTREMAENWGGICGRIECSDKHEELRVEYITENLKKLFGVSRIPAAVVVNNDGSEELKFRAFELDKHYPLDEFRRIFDYIREVDIERDWEGFTKEKIIASHLTLDDLQDKWKAAGYTQLELALDIGINDDRTFRNKTRGKSFDKNEIIKIGEKLKLEVDEVNDLIRECGRTEMTPDEEMKYLRMLKEKN